jgi:hypothetical protein
MPVPWAALLSFDLFKGPAAFPVLKPVLFTSNLGVLLDVSDTEVVLVEDGLVVLKPCKQQCTMLEYAGDQRALPGHQTSHYMHSHRLNEAAGVSRHGKQHCPCYRVHADSRSKWNLILHALP